MIDLQPEINTFYDQQVVQRIADKYGIAPLEAPESYLQSQTYAMFNDPALEMLEFSPAGIFDMWEVEQITGNPRNSLYLRRDEVV
ncbi:MAG: hypothetical protein HFJ72_09060 [Adlercreutzia sp.]|nr:hypothetical protein [Adlercreutzia sp.]